jgi:hypothetical protein
LFKFELFNGYTYLYGRNTAREYVNRLGNQGHPTLHPLFPNTDAVFQDDTAGILQSCFEEQEGEPQHLPWPAHSPDLNITEPLWSVLKTRLRKRFPPQTSLKQLEDILPEERYKILLEAVRNFHDPIERRTAAVYGPTPYK